MKGLVLNRSPFQTLKEAACFTLPPAFENGQASSQCQKETRESKEANSPMVKVQSSSYTEDDQGLKFSVPVMLKDNVSADFY